MARSEIEKLLKDNIMASIEMIWDVSLREFWKKPLKRFSRQRMINWKMESRQQLEMVEGDVIVIIEQQHLDSI